MPVIDVYALRDLFRDGVNREIAEGLTLALLRTEGVQHPAPVQLNNTAAYIHRRTRRRSTQLERPLGVRFGFRCSRLLGH